MNRKKRTQLIILFILLLITAAAFGALKGYLKNAPDEEGEAKEESYSALAIDSSQVTDIGLIGSKGNINLVRTGEGFPSPPPSWSITVSKDKAGIPPPLPHSPDTNTHVCIG